jgi:hypothetical protein
MSVKGDGYKASLSTEPHSKAVLPIAGLPGVAELVATDFSLRSIN